MKEFDLIIVGGGPGGYVAAIRAAQLGMQVAVIEKEKLGGLCLNWGCIPSKALIRSAELYHLLQRIQDFGLTVKDISFEWGKIISRSRKIANRLNKGVHYLLKKNNIEYISGHGYLRHSNIVEVTNHGKAIGEYKSKNIVIATGGSHRSLPDIKIDRKRIITSTEAMSLDELPKSMIIIGGGPIGVEFAYFYNAFGCKVTILEMASQILPLEDGEMVKSLSMTLKKSGITILTYAKVSNVKLSPKDVTIAYSIKNEKLSTSGDIALMAVGFSGNTNGLGLQETDVAIEKTFIKVNHENYTTNVPGLYAVGDVIGAPLLAHVASAEGISCVEYIAGKASQPIDYKNIPSCTYCQPQIASVGLTEQEAQTNGYDIAIGRFPFRPLGKALALGESDGMVKLIVDKKHGELLGAHIVGHEATEMIAELVIARSLETTVHELITTIHAHPTLTEAIMEAASDALGKAIHL